MGAKLKSKTHLLIKFFSFFSLFSAFGFKVLKKCSYDPKNFFLQKSKNILKNADFTLISNLLKKLLKMHTKKF